jgi:hypothetical protein
MKTWLCGVATVAFLFGVWYTWRTLTRNQIKLTPSQLEVRTPFRVFEASWASISGFKRRAFIFVNATDGQHFKVPFYSESIITVFAIKHFGIFESHAVLDKELEEFHAEFSREPGDEFKFRTKWTLPSVRWIAFSVLIAAAVQIAVISR